MCPERRSEWAKVYQKHKGPLKRLRGHRRWCCECSFTPQKFSCVRQFWGVIKEWSLRGAGDLLWLVTTRSKTSQLSFWAHLSPWRTMFSRGKCQKKWLKVELRPSTGNENKTALWPYKCSVWKTSRSPSMSLEIQTLEPVKGLGEIMVSRRSAWRTETGKCCRDFF